MRTLRAIRQLSRTVTVTAVSLVTADRHGKAKSVVVSGLSLAMILGVPTGTLLAQHATWQAAFWAVAGPATLSTTAVLLTLPGRHDTTPPRPALRRELLSLAVPRLWGAYATTALTTSATIAVFSYLDALLQDVARLPEGLVPVVLGLYGVGALAGLTVGGRIADRAPLGALLTGMGTAAVVAAAIAVTAQKATAVIPLAVLLAVGGFLTNPAVNARLFGILGETRTLGSAVNIAAFNVGVAIAPWVSGLVLDAGPGPAGIGWVGAAFALAAVASTLLDRHLTAATGARHPSPFRQSSRQPPPPGNNRATMQRPIPQHTGLELPPPARGLPRKCCVRETAPHVITVRRLEDCWPGA
ncbi:MFS transporter [Streptomyces sp. enrichment culture]|uniref:MFS transporter n=1 Tax=Streptomyces sp. enrichment culture TaxID=1795815 RepID=UPI003F558838